MKNKIRCVTMTTHTDPSLGSWGYIFIHRTGSEVQRYYFRLRRNIHSKRYERGILLMKLFAERNMT